MSGPSKNRSILRLVVSAADGADAKLLEKALSEIASQDTGVNINTQAREGLFSLEGRAESELHSICAQLRDDYRLAINIVKLTAILLETVRRRAEAEGKYIRQTMGSGNYGHCMLRIEPNAGKGYEFISGIKGGVVPQEYIKPIEQGVRDAMELGILAGFPMVDVRVTLLDGSYHDADSNEMAFRFAASIAFREAAKKANPVVLEPMMAVQIHAPDFPTAIAIMEREIFQHRGRIDRASSADGYRDILAIVPLSELLVSEFSPLSKSPMTFAGYEAVRGDDRSDENGPGVTANKPDYPLRGRGFATAQPDVDV
jgi:elongation factor G